MPRKPKKVEPTYDRDDARVEAVARKRGKVRSQIRLHLGGAMNVRVRAALVMALVIALLALTSMACGLPPCQGEGCKSNGCALCVD